MMPTMPRGLRVTMSFSPISQEGVSKNEILRGLQDRSGPLLQEPASPGDRKQLSHHRLGIGLVQIGLQGLAELILHDRQQLTQAADDSQTFFYWLLCPLRLSLPKGVHHRF